MLLWAMMLGLGVGSPCDLSKSAQVSHVLETIEESQRLSVASIWLAEACTLPPSLKKALEGVPRVSLSQVPLLAMEAAAADPALLMEACSGGPQILAQFASADSSTGRALLFDGCNLGRHPAVDRTGFLTASRGAPVLYLLAAQALEGVATDPGIREGLRALAGIPSPRAPLKVVVPSQW